MMEVGNWEDEKDKENEEDKGVISVPTLPTLLIPDLTMVYIIQGIGL
ncbi:MAG: hypothetical protein KME57_23435 [Scytonema hyalinum WJT4-NPBG1]|jgi:hypothetical protein|nr:hypothetical protein [Scytonema hyalinum WJT4-NPBG1]